MVAPRKRDGEKTPPDPPEPIVRDVAASLRKNKSTRMLADESDPVRMS
jgi:hypothetical protein